MDYKFFGYKLIQQSTHDIPIFYQNKNNKKKMKTFYLMEYL